MNNGQAPRIFISGKEYPVTAANSTQVKFVYPVLAAGQFDVNVYVDGQGYAQPTVVSRNRLEVWAISKTSGSTAGNIVYLTGNALYLSNETAFSLTVTKSGTPTQRYAIVESTRSQIGVELWKCDNSEVYTLTVKNNLDSFSFNYTCLSASTPQFTVSTPSPTAYTPTISFSRVNFQAATISKVVAYPIQNGVPFGKDI